MSISRRQFLTLAGASGLLSGLSALYGPAATAARRASVGYGPLVKDPQGIFDLPPAFGTRSFPRLLRPVRPPDPVVLMAWQPLLEPRPNDFDSEPRTSSQGPNKILAAPDRLYDPAAAGAP